MREVPAESIFAAADAANSARSQRAASLALSVLLHLAVFLGGVWLPHRFSFYISPRPYEFEEEPAKEKFVLYYRPPELPAITPTSPSPDAKPTEPDVLATQRMVTVPETPTENRTRVYLPDAPAVQEAKVEAENLIVVAPEPEPVKRPPPKAFVAPTAPKKVEQTVMEAELALPVATARGPEIKSTSSALDDLPDAPLRKATAPEPANAAVPESTARGVSTATNSQSTEPSATVAVVTPTPASGKPPTASAEADFNVGPPGARERSKELAGIEGAVASVPNLAVSPPKGRVGASPGAAAPLPSATGRPPVTPPVRTMVSVALRPGVRRLPAPVEEVFAKRDVYVYLLETRADGKRGPDWTIWFAMTETPLPGQASMMRPPVPTTPIPVAEVAGASGPSARTIHLRGIIRRSGEFEPSGMGDDAAKTRIAGVLRTVPFLPANRNGVATDVDVVIEAQGVR